MRLQAIRKDRLAVVLDFFDCDKNIFTASFIR